jgi:integrase
MPKRVRGLYKRGNVWWCCYKSLSGKIVRQTTETSSYEDAIQFLNKIKAEIRIGKEPQTKKIIQHQFGELAKEYLKFCERQKSFHSKQIMIKQLNNVFKDMPLRYINSLMLEKFQTDRLQRGNKPATANRLIACVKHMFTKAVEWEMVEEESLKRVRKVKLLQENNSRLRFLSREECQNLINACDQHIRPIVIIALNSGMRKSEILNLTWNQVDLKHGFILLEITKNGDRREIPINMSLRNTLQNLPRRLDGGFVFSNPKKGKPYRDIRKSFPSALRKAAIQDFRFHDLRHTFASQLVMAGVDITTIKELLGHKSLAMTLRYSHLAPSHKARAVELLDTVISETPKLTSQPAHNLEDIDSLSA